MKLLFISQNFPYPPYNDGARLKTYNLIKHLSKYNEIYLITFCSREEEGFIEKIAPFCSEIVTVPIREKAGIWAKTYKIINNAIDPRRCASKKMELKIIDAVKLWKPDIVHVELPMMSPYSRTINGIPRIIASHDAISLFAYKNLKASKVLIKKAMWYWLYRQRRWIEEKYYPDYDACTVVSNEDRTILEKHCPALNIKVIPSGVDTEYFKPLRSNAGHGTERMSIGLFGSMDFIPNSEAAQFFCRKIFPLVAKAVPAARCYIVGRRPPAHIQALHNNSDIIVTGEVDDIREYYKKVNVVVAPVRLGSGIKNTVLQAMSMEKAIVSTPQAVQAIDVQNGTHLIVAEEPDEFAAEVVQLLKNTGSREKLGNNSRELIANKYSWQAHAEAFQELYGSIIDAYS